MSNCKTIKLPTIAEANRVLRGACFYKGPSMLDGKPIVGIVTFGTRNEKTGSLAQTWILRDDVHPVEALRNGGDTSICGTCALKNNGCYVNVAFAPSQVWKAGVRGAYPKFERRNPKIRAKLAGRPLRLGAYGDPVAIPMYAWRGIMRLTGECQPGYTHQWRGCDQAWRRYLMASTQSPQETREAQSLGWRTFRTRLADQPLLDSEIVCPASREAGYVRTCETCGACNGSGNNPNRKSIAIIAHGPKSKLGMVERVIREASGIE